MSVLILVKVQPNKCVVVRESFSQRRDVAPRKLLNTILRECGCGYVVGIIWIGLESFLPGSPPTKGARPSGLYLKCDNT